MAIEGITVKIQIQGLEVDQIQELLQTEIGLDALNVGSMTILPMSVQT